MLSIYFVCMQFYTNFVLKCSWNLFISGCTSHLSYRNLYENEKENCDGQTAKLCFYPKLKPNDIMMQMTDNEPFWLAARTRANQEMRLRESLKKLDVTHFLPTRFVVRTYSDRRKRVEVPVISNLIFVKCTRVEAYALLNDHHLHISYLKDYSTGRMLRIAERDMQNFMRFVAHCADNGDYECVQLDEVAPGDRVRIIEGCFTGFEGELVRIDGKTHVVVRIPQVMAMGVKIPLSQLQKIKS